jgi:hypothetical protein
MGISQQWNIHLHELRCHAQIDGSLDFIRQKSFYGHLDGEPVEAHGHWRK